MAIRLRLIGGAWVAICAACSVAKEGDVYLDDGMHHAISNKLAIDYNAMFGIDIPVYEDLKALAKIEESNNPNREWWDSVFGNEAIAAGSSPLSLRKQ